MTIPDDWTPSAENINALPKPLREYIHQLETFTGSAGLIQENAALRVRVEQLEALVAELQRGTND